VLVNGARIHGSTLLRQGDIVRVGDAEFRFEADRADFEPKVALRPNTPPKASSIDSAPSPSQSPLPLLATLEVLTRGADEGRRFRIERPTTQLGRGAHNDVRIADESVSGAHATLLRRATAWHLLDLGSRNGSYIDGERVRERELPSVCELRFGNVKLLFRAIASGTPEDQATRGIVGISAELLRGRRSGT
jgi:pSer/pThr/pTyr-binding forkhead associated (FHA) protein